MKRPVLLGSVLALLASAAVQASLIDAPHNDSSNLTCTSCHSYSLWWMYSPTTQSLAPTHATVVNTVCMKCHDNGSLLGVQTHSAAVISSTNNYHQGTDGWGVGCTDCHNPHYQEQLGWGTEAFLVEGTIDRTAPNNGITHGTVVIGGEEYEQTTIAIAAGLTEKDPDNWPRANWTKKTGVQGRSLILSQDTTVNANTFTVLAATATEIVVKGKLDANAVIPDFDADGPGLKPANSHAADTFGLAYGQLLKKAVVVPFTDPDGAGPLAGESRAVKFVNPIGGFVDTVNTPATGICQVCHTLTADHADQENPLPRFRNSGPPTSASDSHADYANGTTFGGTSTCTICHTHQAGFKGDGHGEGDFGWASISYTKADGSSATVNCAGCHDGNKSVIAIHGYQCGLCHVKESGGGALRIAGSAGSDAVSAANGIDGDPSGSTSSATCATCHDKAARPNIENSPPQIHHTASPHNYAANDACTECHKSAAMAATAHTTAADHAAAIGLAVTTGVPGAVVNGCDACHQPDATTGTDYSTHGTGIGAIIDTDPAVFDNSRVHDRCVSCHGTDGGLKDSTQLTPAGMAMVVSGYAPGHGAGFLPDLDQTTNCFSCHGSDPGFTHLRHSHALTVGNTPQCNWCHVDQIGLNNGAKTDPNNDMVHDACTTCHTISKGLIGDYTVGLVDPLDLTRYPPLVDKIETPLHKGSAVVCTDCHGIHLFADHQHADHTTVVMTSSEGCTDSCHIDTDGNGPPNFGMNLDPLNNMLHDECTSCHDTADGNLKSVAEVDRPYVVAMPDGEALPNMPNDGGGECSACHGGAYFARHRAIDHTTRVAASALCSPCHPAASIAGTSTGIPVDPDNNKVHDACSNCHEVTGELKGAYGRASNMPAGGGTCIDCHGDYRDDHNHDHSTLVRVNTATTPVIANCVGCHGASLAPFVGTGEVHNRLGCRFCHSATDFALIGSAAGKTGGGECITCHGTHFTGHSHTPHLVAMQANDLAQAAPGTACAVCHNDAGQGLATWEAIFTEHRSSCATCHNATRLTGNPDAPGETVQNVIAANADPTACLACHWGKKSPATHGHVAIDFTWAGTCGSCHSGDDIIADVHGGQCTLCHVDPSTGNYNRKAGTDGDATLAGASSTASCTVCHNPTSFPTAGIHHDTPEAVNNGCMITCHPAVDHSGTVAANLACTGCHSGTAGTTTGIPLSLTDAKIHNACSTCHESNGALKGPYGKATSMPAGGGDCTACHGADFTLHSTVSHQTRVAATAECVSCHTATAGTAAGMPVSTTDNQVHDACTTCHGANGLLLGVAAANDVETPAEVTQMVAGNCTTCHGNPNSSGHCLACHSVAQDNGDGTPVGGRRAVVGEFPASNGHAHYGATLNNESCLVCHDMATHKDGYVDLIDADTGTTYHFQRPQDLATDPDLSTFCQSCHDANGAARLAAPLDPFGNGNVAPDIKTKFLGTLQWSEWYGDYCFGSEGTMRAVNSHHDISNTDQTFSGAKIECLSCHGVHIASKTTPLANPNNTNAAWSGTYNGFCLTCHSGGSDPANPGFPTGVSGPAIALRGMESCGYGNPPWWVDYTWSNSAHGPNSKRSWPGYSGAPSYELSCKDCHDPHGSYTATNTAGNPYMIRDVVDGSGYVDDGARSGQLWTGPPWTTFGGNRAVKITINGADVSWGGTEGLCNVCHARWQDAMWAHSDCGACQTCHGHGQAWGEYDGGNGGNDTPCGAPP